MALVACPECYGHISDQAPTCPHCGFSFWDPAVDYLKGRIVRRLFVLLVLIAIPIVVLLLVGLLVAHLSPIFAGH